MTARRSLKLTHMASTVWFVVCVGYILVLTLHEFGFKWWQIFSLSGHSAIVVSVLISVYLFALVRDMGSAQQIQVEHPFTSTQYYMGFYVAAPLLGGLAGIFGMLETIDTIRLSRYALGVALGTLGTTFCVWVVLDPMIGLIEMLLPPSRRHRAQRLAQAEMERRARQEKRDKLLADAVARERQERERWRQILEPQAQRLAVLLGNDSLGRRAEQEAVDIGANAWHLGGLNCMRQLRDMALAITKTPPRPAKSEDYISYWWDGIGDWRRPSRD